MKIIADLHLHSHFSRATSKNLNLENLHKWAQLKGLTVIGTGDIAHPGWLQEMKDKLEPAEEGLFKLKDEVAAAIQTDVFPACAAPVRFMMAGEISNIYKRHDKVRKIHNVVFMPSIEALEKFQGRLERIGNIRSDGRPILGLDSRDLLEIALETDPQGYLIPAHIWTPWFAMLGSMSGFDSVEECFGDLTKHIFALETGLSSDPPMNWQLSILDDYTLVSNSDAHSPQKLAREANVFDTALSYPAIFDALKTGDDAHFKGTIEFFPEEGKYHYDGHRKCGIRWNPKETLANDCVCTKCGKRVTVGVMHRVETLADREFGEKPQNYHAYQSLIPLPELLAEIHNVGPTSRKVQQSFEFLLSKIGSELHILLEAPLEDIARKADPMVAEGIKRMREGNIHIAAGYDGEFGTIRIFDDDERQDYSKQLGLFIEKVKREKPADGHPPQTASPRKLPKKKPPQKNSNSVPQNKGLADELNEQQKKAVQHFSTPLIITAGPGTGKTRTLTSKIANLLIEKEIPAKNILAITFTNRAAAEMKARLISMVEQEKLTQLTVCTFHSLGAQILRKDVNATRLSEGFSIAGDLEKRALLKQIRPKSSGREIQDYVDAIALCKNQLAEPDDLTAMATLSGLPNLAVVYHEYEAARIGAGQADFEDLILSSVTLLKRDHAICQKWRTRFKWLFVDEYQDLNRAQYELLRLLARDNQNLTVIGDPDQSIYGFRGANPSYFLRFEDDFPNAVSMSLSRNYRSTQNIVRASTQLLGSQVTQREQKLWSEAISNAKITIHKAATEKAEAEYVVHQIESALGGTSYFSIDSGRVLDETDRPSLDLNDFTVLLRTKAILPPLLEAFDRSGIPYEIVGESPFFEKPPIKQILAYLWFFENSADSIRLTDIVRHLNIGLGEKALQNLLDFASSQHIGLWEALRKHTNNVTLLSPQKAAAQEFVNDLTSLRDGIGKHSVSDKLEAISAFHLSRNRPISDEQKAAIDRIARLAKPFEHDAQKFLESLTLGDDGATSESEIDRIRIMTIHATKGLEFKFVFIIGCENGIIPFKHARGKVDEEEEKRLLYVGMTRAQHNLHLTHCAKRMLFGKTLEQRPSRYLNAIEAALKEFSESRQRTTGKAKTEPPSHQIDLF